MINSQHFLNTAKEVGFAINAMEQILQSMASVTEQVITQVEQELPTDFPTFISAPIFEGMRRYSRRILF